MQWKEEIRREEGRQEGRKEKYKKRRKEGEGWRGGGARKAEEERKVKK
jgi:hypothetical protein